MLRRFRIVQPRKVKPPLLPLPRAVEFVQVDVGKKRRDHATLGCPRQRLPHRPVLHHPGHKPLADKCKHPPVRDPLRHHHQLLSPGARTVGIPSGRCFPSAFGMYRRLTGLGRYRPAKRSARMPSRNGSTPFSSMALMLCSSTPPASGTEAVPPPSSGFPPPSPVLRTPRTPSRLRATSAPALYARSLPDAGRRVGSLLFRTPPSKRAAALTPGRPSARSGTRTLSMAFAAT